MIISSNTELAQFCREAMERTWCALDTEFTWTRTYSPRLGLIQLGFPGKVVAVDMTAVDDPDPLRALFNAPTVTKVIHAVDQDARIISHDLKVTPAPVFDTQVGAGFLGLGEQVGYAALVKHFLDVRIDKTEQFTDWISRPLRPEQIAYALDDVRYLGKVYPLMIVALEQLGRLDWALEDSRDTVARSVAPGPEDDALWLTIRGRGRLDRAGAFVLRELARWREETARQEDCRPCRILPDDLLLRLAKGERIRDNDLRGMWRSQVARIRSFVPRAREVADTARDRIAAGEAQLPELSSPRALDRIEKRAFAVAWDWLASTAKRLGIPRPCLATRRDVEALVRHCRRGPRGPELRPLTGWRRAVFGRDMVELVTRVVGDLGTPSLPVTGADADGTQGAE